MSLLSIEIARGALQERAFPEKNCAWSRVVQRLQFEHPEACLWAHLRCCSALSLIDFLGGGCEMGSRPARLERRPKWGPFGELVAVRGLGHRHGLVVLVHVLDESDDVLCGAVRAERPGCVGVADRDGVVGQALHHAALPDKQLVGLDGLLVHRGLDVTANVELEAGGGDDEVARDALAVLEDDLVAGDLVNVAGGNVRLALAERRVKVAVRADAQTLVPRVVARLEVRVERDVLGQLCFGHGAEDALGDAGEGAEDVVGGVDAQNVLLTDEEGGHPARHDGTHDLGDGVVFVERDNVGGRALDERDVLGDVGHGRDEGDGGGARADDGDALAAVVVLGDVPELRVDDLALEVLDAGDVGLEGGVVVIVAGAGVEEARAELLLLAVLLGGDEPASLLGGPVGVGDGGLEVDVGGDTVLVGDPVEVGDDLLALGDVGTRPLLEGVAEGVEVRVGANAGILEEIPGGVDARDTGTDDEEIEHVGRVVVDRAHGGDACSGARFDGKGRRSLWGWEKDGRPERRSQIYVTTTLDGQRQSRQGAARLQVVRGPGPGSGACMPVPAKRSPLARRGGGFGGSRAVSARARRNDGWLSGWLSGLEILGKGGKTGAQPPELQPSGDGATFTIGYHPDKLGAEP
ncbi:hypothetical protein L1887_61344 [Cichorium endivia]|nr:hypothetical protein L1887_61344 [Cichorium endivia]